MARLTLPLLCAIQLCVATLSGVHAAEVRLDIIVTGNKHVDAEAIRSRFHSSQKHGFSSEDLDEAVKALYATHLFSNVTVRRTESAVTINVTENPRIARVAFEGNKAIKDKDLKQLLRSKEAGPLSAALVHDDVEVMLELYHRRGRFDAHIVPKTIDNKERGLNLIYEISEGERTGISEIRFTGNNAFAADKLRGVIKTGRTNILSFLLDNDFYDPDKVGIDCDLLGRFYRAHGYPDAQVVSAKPQYDSKSRKLVLTFKIQEGARYRFGTVAVKSDIQGIETDAFHSLVATDEGDIYNADAIDRTVSAILTKLAGRSEPFATVKPEIERVAERKEINVAYRLEQGPRIYVERIEIHGNKKTKENVIRREIGLDEGAPYNRALVESSERRLKKLGFFKSVKFSQRKGSTPDRTVVDVTVEEQETGQFSIAGGYSDTDGWVANVSLGDSNFFGRGEAAKISVDYGQYVRGFNIGFIEPYLFGQKVALGLDLFARQTEANSNQSYSSTFYGGKIGFTAPLTDELSQNFHYGLTNQMVTLDPSRGPVSIPVQQAAAAGSQWVSSVGSATIYNTLNDDRHPTSGIWASTNNDVAGLGGDVKFLRTTNDVRYYSGLSEDLTSITRAQTGYIAPWGDQTLPLLNGFFGGPALVRGFAVNGFGPRAITPGTTMDNLGGNAYWATSQELQAPLPMVPPEFQLRGALFADAGSLWGTKSASYAPALSQSLQVNNSRAVRSAVGAGLIWDSILGPLRVDYAYPITKGPYDVTQRLHFGFGMF
ncbi:MAG TPA: outer membrane protein assembly factor BamA [Pseudolabrys sp.]|nr:outer membrane protein assembly factor BamA [Pseudolabrys sp.]